MAKLKQAIKAHYQELAHIRAAFFTCIWQENEAAVLARYPYLRDFSLRRLRLLLEIFSQHDYIAPQWQPAGAEAKKANESANKPKRLIDALLGRLEHIRQIPYDHQHTFNTLMSALDYSDSWRETLFNGEGAVEALAELSTLHPQERANWNWLLQRHVESCRCVDLGDLWQAFQYFNTQYRKLTHSAPLDFTQFSPDSVNNMYLFLDCLLTILNNARNIEEQIDLLQEAGMQVDESGAAYASLYKNYYMLSKEMRLTVPKEELKKGWAYHRDNKKSQPAPVDYTVDKATLLDAFQAESKVALYGLDDKASFEQKAQTAFYRYLGQQPRAALKIMDYRSCAASVTAESGIDAKEAFTPDPLLVLLALTTTIRFAGSREEILEASQRVTRIAQKAKVAEYASTLVDGYRQGTFPELTFLEIALLIERWCKKEPTNRQQQIENDRKTIMDPAQRHAFLRNLHGTQELEIKSHEGLSAKNAASIEGLLNDFAPASGATRDRLNAMLKTIWAQHSDLSEDQARRFLRLLSDSLVWRTQREPLIQLLAEHPHLAHYDFVWLAQLLQAVSGVPRLDTKLSIFNVLLSIDPKADQTEIAGLLKSGEDFLNAVKALCHCKVLSTSERNAALHSLLAYAQSPFYNPDQLTALQLSELILQLASKNTPSCLEATVQLVKDAAKEASEQKTAEHLAATWSGILALLNKPDELEALVYALAGGPASTKERAEILEACASAHPEALSIFAASFGRKDSGNDILSFIAQIQALQTKNASQFQQLYRLCQHPPFLGVKILSEALKKLDSEPNALLALELNPYEHDPHICRTTLETANAFNPEESKAQIAKIQDLSSQYQGHQRPLFASQQDNLLRMVTAVNEARFEVKEAKNPFRKTEQPKGPLGRREMTRDEIVQALQTLRATLKQPDLKEQDKQDALLQGIALMQDAMYRTTGKLLDQTQILAIVNTMVRNTQDNCFTQIDTGQGKTLGVAVIAACMWLLYDEALVQIGDVGLSQRDFHLNRDFFRFLGIPVGKDIIRQESRPEDCCQDGINYTTLGGKQLFEDKQALEAIGDGKPKPRPKRLGVVMEEEDEPFLDQVHLGFRSTINLLNTDSQADTPLAPFYTAMAQDFLNSSQYQALTANPGATEDEAVDTLKTFLLGLPNVTAAQKTLLKQLLQLHHRQIKTWFISIIRMTEMREKVEFSTIHSTHTIDGVEHPIQQVRPYANNGRLDSGVEFSYGLQQLLQAVKQKQADEQKKTAHFMIQQESFTLLASNTETCFRNPHYARMVGVSATVGSELEICKRMRRFPIRVNRIPPHQPKQNVKDPVVYVDNAEAHKDRVKAEIRQFMRSGRPILVITEDAEHLQKHLEKWAEEVLEEEKQATYTRQSLSGEEKHKDEQAVIEIAAKKNVITLATRLAGRGFDVQSEDKEHGLAVMVIKPMRKKRFWWQCLGRTRRRGAKGDTLTIINKEDLANKNGDRYATLEAYHAANETADLQEWELDNHLGYVRKEMAKYFLQIHQQVNALEDRNLTQQLDVHQVYFLQSLDESWEALKTKHQLDSDLLTNYGQRLQACRKEFLDETIALWQEEVLETFQKDIALFREQQTRARHRKPRDDQEATDKLKQVTEHLDRVEATIAASATLTAAQLEDALPREQLPYFDLPQFSDIPDAYRLGPTELNNLNEDQQKLYKGLATLVKTECIEAGAPEDEVKAAIQAFFTRDCPELRVDSVELDAKHASTTRAVTIRYQSAEAGAISVVFEMDYSTKSLAFRGHKSVSATAASSQSFSKFPWLVFFLSWVALCAGGIALGLTGAGAALGLPLFGLAQLSLAGGLSLALLSNPALWTLVGIGAAYGTVAFVVLAAAALLIHACFTHEAAPKETSPGGATMGTSAASLRPLHSTGPVNTAANQATLTKGKSAKLKT